MFVLFVEMHIKPGAGSALEATYTRVFRPAISSQPGFRAVELLKPNKDGVAWRLSIAFETHELQKQWVATDLHQQVWPKMEAHFAEYTVADYTPV